LFLYGLWNLYAEFRLANLTSKLQHGYHRRDRRYGHGGTSSASLLLLRSSPYFTLYEQDH